MRFKSMTAALAAMALATPALAAPAAKLSLSPVTRAGAAEGDERLAGGSGAILAGIIALGIIAIPVVDALIDDDDDDSPVSP